METRYLGMNSRYLKKDSPTWRWTLAIWIIHHMARVHLQVTRVHLHVSTVHRHLDRVHLLLPRFHHQVAGVYFQKAKVYLKVARVHFQVALSLIKSISRCLVSSYMSLEFFSICLEYFSFYKCWLLLNIPIVLWRLKTLRYDYMCPSKTMSAFLTFITPLTWLIKLIMS